MAVLLMLRLIEHIVHTNHTKIANDIRATTATQTMIVIMELDIAFVICSAVPVTKNILSVS